MVADVAFSNPFSLSRAAVVARLISDAPRDRTSDREALARVVAPRLQSVLREGAQAVERLGDDDRRLVETALLYVTYHRYLPQIDALIERQAGQSGAPLTMSFGDEVLADLGGHGFAAERAARYFAGFFQVRRAFYFIDRALAGECESMRRLREALWNNVFTYDMRGYDAALLSRMEDFSTLILGETGTGKGSAAAAIGRSAFIPYAAAERRFVTNFADSGTDSPPVMRATSKRTSCRNSSGDSAMRWRSVGTSITSEHRR